MSFSRFCFATQRAPVRDTTATQLRHNLRHFRCPFVYFFAIFMILSCKLARASSRHNCGTTAAQLLVFSCSFLLICATCCFSASHHVLCIIMLSCCVVVHEIGLWGAVSVFSFLGVMCYFVVANCVILVLLNVSFCFC